MPPAIKVKTILLICLVISIGQLSMGLISPALPWIAKDFAITSERAQLMVSLYLLGFGPSQFIYGPISDAIGRKKVLIAGLLIALFGLLITIFFQHSFTVMLIGRLLQGIGAGCCAVLARASARDRFDNDQLPVAMSYIAMTTSTTALVAPILGGFINYHFGWVVVFISLLGYLCCALVLIVHSVDESMTQFTPLPSIKNTLLQYKALLTSGHFLHFASLGWLNFSMIIITLSIMPFIMQNQIGMNSFDYALWALIPALGKLVGAFICNRISPIIGVKKMLCITPLLHFSSAVWFYFCPVVPLYLMLGQLLMILGVGIAIPCAQALVMRPYKQSAGITAAMYGGGQMIVSAVISMLLMWIGLNQIWQLSIIIMLFAAFSFINLLSAFHSQQTFEQQI